MRVKYIKKNNINDIEQAVNDTIRELEKRGDIKILNISTYYDSNHYQHICTIIYDYII